ncbi:glycosyltransferase [Asanoa sp. WMMD1127]|uniref:glycosyltransferase n=1 Tax=Asanoa sp. WMMD1127 TaxID=3016107 RepID=UPI00241658EA|nr:glycosyltransferase [Asanoa sp. WMMD1127]MDG4821494.1 glycosyltransferase [Asanoa sp. WMMD1127]
MPTPNDAAEPVRIFRNDWSVLQPPEIGSWTPTRTVSVVIPAYNCQESLNLTLASLAHQTYPEELLEVVIADDTSEPPLELPKIRPGNCRIVRVADHSSGWGRANALHVGATNSTGEIIHWLDADMVVFPEHVEAQVRWHHVSDEVVTLGYKRFTTGWSTPEEIAERCAAGTIDALFAHNDTEPHDYVEKIIDDTDQLRAGDHLNFRAHVGATAALTRRMYDETGGLDTTLRLGEDTEFGFRLTQAGAAFVPEPKAGSWHMGPTNMMQRGEQLRRYNRPFLADLMPQPRWLRSVGNRSWKVPLVTAVVRAEGNYELVKTCVDLLLMSDLTDLRVMLVGDWGALSDERMSVLKDPHLDLRLVEATYRHEPRVALVSEAPDDVYPSPYLLRVPTSAGVDANTVRRLVRLADEWQVGLVRVLPPKAASPDNALALWRTAALRRAARCKGPDESWEKAVLSVAGERWVSARDFAVANLSEWAEEDLVSPKPRLVARPTLGNKVSFFGVDTIPVGGARSLALAARFVALRAASGARRRLNNKLGRQPE